MVKTLGKTFGIPRIRSITLKIMLRWSVLVRRNVTEVAVVKAVFCVALLFSDTRQLPGGVLGD
jgi:hypothetical protein